MSYRSKALRAKLPKKVISVKPRPMGRKKRWAEDMVARFATGTFARISAVLRPGEDRTDFVRQAVERELKTREARKAMRVAKAGD
jgi:hypothetical protein